LCDGQTNCDGTLSPKSFINYFQPLENWLDEQQKLHKYTVGWNTDGKWTPKGSYLYLDDFHTFEGYDEVPVEAPGATTTGPPTTSTTSSNAAFTAFTFALLSLILF
jgi:hypothetical protein